MAVYISSEILARIEVHGEAAYPEEGAGLLLGTAHEQNKHVFELLEFDNARETDARHNRYLITPEDYLAGEQEAMRLGLDVVGVYHSHPDHPNQPSEFDREWAMPWLVYIITSIEAGNAVESRAWLLSEKRAGFDEEPIMVTDQNVSRI